MIARIIVAALLLRGVSPQQHHLLHHSVPMATRVSRSLQCIFGSLGEAPQPGEGLQSSDSHQAVRLGSWRVDFTSAKAFQPAVLAHLAGIGARHDILSLRGVEAGADQTELLNGFASASSAEFDAVMSAKCEANMDAQLSMVIWDARRFELVGNATMPDASSFVHGVPYPWAAHLRDKAGGTEFALLHVNVANPIGLGEVLSWVATTMTPNVIVLGAPEWPDLAETAWAYESVGRHRSSARSTSGETVGDSFELVGSESDRALLPTALLAESAAAGGWTVEEFAFDEHLLYTDLWEEGCTVESYLPPTECARLDKPSEVGASAATAVAAAAVSQYRPLELSLCFPSAADVDCIGSWSACTASCEPRRFTVTREQSGRGAPCAASGERSVAVDGDEAECFPGDGECPLEPWPARCQADGTRCPVLLDVRTYGEWLAGHATCAVRLPLQTRADGTERVKALAGGDLDQPLVTYCYSGQRADRAEALLGWAGFTDVMSGLGWVLPLGNAAVLESMCSCEDAPCPEADGAAADACANADEACAGDLDGNLAVDVSDLLALLARFGEALVAGGCVCGCAVDLDQDFAVGVGDLLQLLARFGSDC